MKQRKKQLLGVLGLIGVMIMTAIAYALPTYAVSSDSAETTVRLTVIGPGHSLTIMSPQDGETIAVNTANGNVVLIAKANQEHLSKIHYLMTCVDDAGNQTKAEAESNITEATGSDEATLTMPASASNSDCTLKARGFDDKGAEVASDQVNFSFRAMSVAFTGKYDEFGNPEVMLIVTNGVDHVVLQVHDKQGNPIFVNANGDSEAIEITNDKFTVLDNGNLSYTMYLPMNKYHAPVGSYDLVSVAYGNDGSVMSMNVNDFYYDPGAAGVPSTGSIIKDLNISRADFILTGMVMFTAVSGFALYLIFRKRRQA